MQQCKLGSYPDLRFVNEFPPFPDNPFGLRRGSHIYCDDADLAKEFRFPVGQPVPLCFNGTFIRCNNLGWLPEALIEDIRRGNWKISDEAPIAEKLLPQMEFQMGRQVLLKHLWGDLWENQVAVPDIVCLECAPDVTQDDIKSSALAHKKHVVVMAEVLPPTVQPDGSSATMTVIAGDAGSMSLGLVGSLPQLLADYLPLQFPGDKFFVCHLPLATQPPT